MKNQNRFNAKIEGLVRSIFTMVVRAEEEVATEPVVTPPVVETVAPKTPTPVINYEQLIAQARKDEKDKLYTQITGLKTDNKTMIEKYNILLLENGQLKVELEGIKASNGESKKVKELEGTIETLNGEIEDLKKQPDIETIKSDLRKEFEVENHKTMVLESNKDLVLSQFRGEVTGSTVEEIDLSLAKAIEKTEAIKAELGVAKVTPKKDNTTPAPKKLSTPPVAIPNESHEQSIEAELDYVAKLDPASKEYAEWREKNNLK